MNLLIGVRYNFYLNTEHLTFTEKVNGLCTKFKRPADAGHTVGVTELLRL